MANTFNGSKLKQLRNEAELTQNEVAVRMGFGNQSGTQIGVWERGEKKPTETNIHKLAELFNVPIQEFYTKQGSAREARNANRDSVEYDAVSAVSIGELTAHRLTEALKSNPLEQLTYIGVTNEGHLVIQDGTGTIYRAVPL